MAEQLGRKAPTVVSSRAPSQLRFNHTSTLLPPSRPCLLFNTLKGDAMQYVIINSKTLKYNRKMLKLNIPTLPNLNRMAFSALNKGFFSCRGKRGSIGKERVMPWNVYVREVAPAIDVYRDIVRLETLYVV